MKHLIGIIILLIITLNAKAAEDNSTGVADWGLGFGLGIEQYKDTYIDSASLRGDDRIVITGKSFKTRPSAWLTMNWNIWGVGDGKSVRVGGKSTTVYDTRWGFFAGVKIIDGNSEAFSAFALGPQVSFVLKERVISVGLGWVTHQTREYAQGISAGEVLPSHYDDIAFEEGTENSYMLMMSVSF